MFRWIEKSIGYLNYNSYRHPLEIMNEFKFVTIKRSRYNIHSGNNLVKNILKLIFQLDEILLPSLPRRTYFFLVKIKFSQKINLRA